MKVLIITVNLVSILLLSGCAGPSFWFNPEKSNQETNADVNFCKFEAAKHSKDSNGYSSLLNMCIENKGYRYVNNFNISQVGNEYYRNREYNTAIGYYEKALFFRPKSVPLYNNIANSYNNLKDYNNAIINYEKGIGADPDNFIAYAGLGYVYFRKNELDRAIQYFNKCLDINKSYFGCILGKGMISYKRAKYDEAVGLISQSLETKESVEGYYYRGLSYLKLNNKDKAIADFSKGCEALDEESCKEHKKHSRL